MKADAEVAATTLHVVDLTPAQGISVLPGPVPSGLTDPPHEVGTTSIQEMDEQLSP